MHHLHRPLQRPVNGNGNEDLQDDLDLVEFLDVPDLVLVLDLDQGSLVDLVLAQVDRVGLVVVLDSLVDLAVLVVLVVMELLVALLLVLDQEVVLCIIH